LQIHVVVHWFSRMRIRL